MNHYVCIQMEWRQAYDWCGAQGMQMAMFRTPEEIDNISEILRERQLGETRISSLAVLQKFIFPDKMLIWIAATDMGRAPGDFIWADGSAIDAETWAPGEPDDIEDGENCVNLSGHSARLNGAKCNEVMKFMCIVPRFHYTCPPA
jgi:hypothetical protein